MEKPVYCLEYFYAKPGCKNQLLAALLKLIPLSKAEPGCLQYDVLNDHNDKDLIILIVKFSSMDLMEKHEKQDFIKLFVENEMKEYCDNFTWNYASDNVGAEY